MDRRELGSQAESPTQIPVCGWRQVLQRAIRKSQEHNTSLLAAGVALFAFLALYPALIALVTVVALAADPNQITQQVQSFTVGLPPTARQLIYDPLTALTRSSGETRTIGLVISLLVALWSASSGTSSLMTAVNLAYDEKEKRSFLKFRAIALLLTVGAIVFLILTLALIAVVPVVLSTVPLGAFGLVLAQVLRWVLLFALIIFGLAVVYRVAPARNPPKFRWVTLGSVVAALLWLLGSVGFSLYVDFFGDFNKIYGALAGVIVLLLWLYLTCYVIVLGGEINAEAERQTACDTTVGEPKPMGQRGAVVADTMP
ncbi:MAG: YihY/virulence factor BrkB family protein [Pseudonocardiales bacterium]|nr:YihY/virulence factor BrkB family protein [Pseudonocardiales bacterium]MBV9031825.1 YihY/virulence factor BrkB family protein [Pseudonocardiales bacterium]MBW0009008.1 YihY/virulence factor BrkB family protein [Pseudonocardiales bacterium]